MLFAQSPAGLCVFRGMRVFFVCIYYRGFTCSFVFFILVHCWVHIEMNM